MHPTKEAIFKVAINYVKTGMNLEKVSLEKITKEANIGKSTFYGYFSSKDVLVEESYIYLINSYHLRLINNILCNDFKKSLKNQIAIIIAVTKDAKDIMEAILENPYHLSTSNKKIYTAIQNVHYSIKNQMENIFKLGQEEGIISNKYLEEKSQYIIKALITSLSIQFVTSQTSLDEEEIIELIYDVLVSNLQ